MSSGATRSSLWLETMMERCAFGVGSRWNVLKIFCFGPLRCNNFIVESSNGRINLYWCRAHYWTTMFQLTTCRWRLYMARWSSCGIFYRLKILKVLTEMIHEMTLLQGGPRNTDLRSPLRTNNFNSFAAVIFNNFIRTVNYVFNLLKWHSTRFN